MQTILMMDFGFRLMCEIPHFVNLTIRRSFWGVGAFQLTLDRGMMGWDQVEPDRLLFLPDRPEVMLLTEKVLRTERKVTVTGVQLKGLCKRRICVPPQLENADEAYQAFGWDRFSGDAESAYLHYAKNNLTDPEDEKRKMPGLVLAENAHRGPVLPWQARFDRLHDVLEDIGQATGLGWDIRPDFERRQFVFMAWEGRDLTSGSRLATLSRELGNVDGARLCVDRSGEIGTVYAGGGGEDENRLILSVGNETEGFARREGWTDVAGAEDAEMLRMGAERKMAPEKRTLTVEMTDNGLCRYGRDYDVGDVICIRAEEYGMNARLIEMEEVLEDGRRSLKATFGDAPVTLTSILKMKEKGSAR